MSGRHGMMGGTMSGGMGGMGGMGFFGSRICVNGRPDASLKVATRAYRTKERLARPQRLSRTTRSRLEDAVNGDRPRTFPITMRRMRWGFNGLSYQMDSVAPDEVMKPGITEACEFRNSMMMAHAIHLHGLQFQVLDRSHGSPADDVTAGRVDAGWEDTVLLMRNERVRLIMRFADFTGRMRTGATCWNTPRTGRCATTGWMRE